MMVTVNYSKFKESNKREEIHQLIWIIGFTWKFQNIGYIGWCVLEQLNFNIVDLVHA